MHWLIISIEFNAQALHKMMERSVSEQSAERDGRSGSGNGAEAGSVSYRNKFECGAAFHCSCFAHMLWSEVV